MVEGGLERSAIAFLSKPYLLLRSGFGTVRKNDCNFLQQELQSLSRIRDRLHFSQLSFFSYNQSEEF